ncbi:YceI family protein [Dokdonella sp.]|uniref:YceI family protein n=1 Tax=Dokdonella sp. TaxID=2291710 RepID=UPI003528C577
MFVRTLLATAVALASASAFAAAETYVIDPTHTQAEFTWSHFGFSNPSGNFDKIEGSITYDAADPAQSSVDVTIAIDSINTHVEKLDNHMKSPDIFDAAKYPTATFKSTKVEKAAGEGKFKVTGDLTIHGVTRSVVLDTTLNRAEEHPMKKVPAIGFDASTTIKRSDFGIDYLVPKVSDEIRIKITTEATVPKKDAG